MVHLYVLKHSRFVLFYNQRNDLLVFQLNLLPIENTFFGPTVNVSGLLTGSCLIDGLKAYLKEGKISPGDKVYLPSIMIRDRGDTFLDGLSIEDVKSTLELDLVFLPQDGQEMIDTIFGGEN